MEYTALRVKFQPNRYATTRTSTSICSKFLQRQKSNIQLVSRKDTNQPVCRHVPGLTQAPVGSVHFDMLRGTGLVLSTAVHATRENRTVMPQCKWFLVPNYSLYQTNILWYQI